MDYRNIIEIYLKNNIDASKLINEIYLSYPSCKIEKKMIAEIIQQLHDYLEIPYNDIKLIGSAQIGFSLIKSHDFDDNGKSDIDFAIINKEMFLYLQELTLTKTNGFKDFTNFKNNTFKRIFLNNFCRGYIRPDTLVKSDFKFHLFRFLDELEEIYDREITLAFYLNEISFRFKVKEGLDKYKAQIMDT